VLYLTPLYTLKYVYTEPLAPDFKGFGLMEAKFFSHLPNSSGLLCLNGLTTIYIYSNKLLYPLVFKIQSNPNENMLCNIIFDRAAC